MKTLRLFISYPSECRSQVEPVVLALRNRGHKVFFDRDDLPPGQEYNDQIEAAICSCTAMVFFIIPNSFAAGRYQASELEVARRRWPSAHRHVLPVSLAATNLEIVPPYLKSVTILEPAGNLAAEVSHAVAGLSRWNWKHLSALVGVVIVGGLTFTVALLVTPSLEAPKEVTEQMADTVVDELLPEADKVHIKKIIRAENARPFLFVVYVSGRDIVFAAIKWRDGQWRIVRTIRDSFDDFTVSSWELEVDLNSKSIVFSGCRPKMCSDAWGYLFYQFELDREWLLKASSSESGPAITAPVGFPERAVDLFNFERRFYKTKVSEFEPDASIDATILAFPRRRMVPPLWEEGDEETDKARDIKKHFICALALPSDTTINRIYREDFNGDGRVEWLVQTVAGNKSLNRLHTLTATSPKRQCVESLAARILGRSAHRASKGGENTVNYANQIFEDPGDVDSAWTRLALYPIPDQAPYLVVGGYGGSGAFPFWYVLQETREGRFARRPATEAIENMLNEAFPKFLEGQAAR